MPRQSQGALSALGNEPLKGPITAQDFCKRLIKLMHLHCMQQPLVLIQHHVLV